MELREQAQLRAGSQVDSWKLRGYLNKLFITRTDLPPGRQRRVKMPGWVGADDLSQPGGNPPQPVGQRRRHPSTHNVINGMNNP